jgi:hypothetical protein
MTMSDENENGPLGAAREHRVKLRQAMVDVEQAAAGAAGDPTWRADLTAALTELLSAFDGHVEEVDAPDGLLKELVQLAPRLQARVAKLDGEHPELRTMIESAIGVVEAGDVADVRSETMAALGALAAHRTAGADLVYDAYNVDIGGE